jgi:hypothetical protein
MTYKNLCVEAQKAITDVLTKTERERTLEFLTGWLMEFGSEPIKHSTFKTNAWWRQAVADAHRGAYNSELIHGPWVLNDHENNRFGITEEALALIKGTESSTVTDKPKEDA